MNCTDFLVLIQPCIPGVNPTWSKYEWVQSARLLLRIFESVHMTVISYLTLSLSVVGTWVMLASQVRLEVFSLLCFLEDTVYRTVLLLPSCLVNSLSLFSVS